MPHAISRQSSQESISSQYSISSNEADYFSGSNDKSSTKSTSTTGKSGADEGYNTGSSETLNEKNNDAETLKANTKFTESQTIIEYITKNPISSFWWTIWPFRWRHGSKIPFRFRPELEKIFIILWQMGLNDIATALYSQLPVYYNSSNKQELKLEEDQKNQLFQDYIVEQEDDKDRLINKALELSKNLGIETEKSQLHTALNILDDLGIKEINNTAELHDALNKTFDWLSADESYQDQRLLEKLRKSIRGYASEIGARKQLHNFNKLDWRIKNIIEQIASEIGAKKELSGIKGPQAKMNKLEQLINNEKTESAKKIAKLKKLVDDKKTESATANTKILKAIENLRKIQRSIDDERKNSPHRLYGYIPNDSIIRLKRMKDVKQFGSVDESIFSVKEDEATLGKKSKRIKWGKVIGWGLVLTFVIFLVAALALGSGGTAVSFLIAHAFVKAFCLTSGVAGTTTNFILYWNSCSTLFGGIYKNGITSIFKDEHGNYLSKEQIIATSMMLIPCLAAAVATGFITFTGTQATVISLCLLVGVACPHLAVLVIAGVVALAGTIGLGMLFFKAIKDFIQQEKYKDVANYFKTHFYDIWKYSTDENNKSWADLTKSQKAVHILKGVLVFLKNTFFLALRILPAIIAFAVTIGISHSSAQHAMSSLFHCSKDIATIASDCLIGIASGAYAFFFGSSILNLLDGIVKVAATVLDAALHPKKNFAEIRKKYQSANPIYKREFVKSIIEGFGFFVCAVLNAFANGVGGKNPESTKNVGIIFHGVGKKVIENTDQVIGGAASFGANWGPGREVTREPRFFNSREVKGVSSKRYSVKHQRASVAAPAC